MRRSECIINKSNKLITLKNSDNGIIESIDKRFQKRKLLMIMNTNGKIKTRINNKYEIIKIIMIMIKLEQLI